ncbi:helix-turn-helix domain-containing protein [Paenibacillus koleovorans]|uniref:helix-turn-helix domain-containing protein n=1 Tax=Paenibacillus koleovorans TaxID=121608 RepID=UPI000FDC23D9|nr:helix-turn-helix domain-containing protein [Paenibacillus koleovorans]
MSGKSVYLRSVIYMITIVSAVVLLGCAVYYTSIRSHILNELMTSNARMDKQIASTYELFLDTTIKAAMVSIGEEQGGAGAGAGTAVGAGSGASGVPGGPASTAGPSDESADGAVTGVSAGTAFPQPPLDNRNRVEFENRQIYEQLNRLTRISDFIHSAYYYTRNHVYVSMGFSFELSDFYDKDWTESLDTSKDLTVLPARKLPTLPNGDKEVIPIVMNFPLHALNHTYTYVLHIDANQLFRFLIRNQDVYEGFQFRIIDPSGMIFVSSDPEDELFRQIQDYAYLRPERVLGSLEDNYITTRDGKKRIVSSYSSPLYGWKYVSESDYDPLSRSMLVPLQIIAVIVALSLVVSVLAVTSLSRRLYRPVKDIVRLLGLNEADNRDEYELITGHIHQFINENQKLKEAVDLNRSSLKRQFLYDLLVRNVYGEQEIREKLDYFGLAPQANYTIIVIGVDEMEQYVNRFSLRDRMLWEFAMENIVMEIVRRTGSGFFLSLETAKFAVAVSFEDTATGMGSAGTGAGGGSDIRPGAAETENRAADLAYAIKEAVRSYIKISLSAGVGLARESAAQLNKSYQEGLAALAYAETVGPFEVVTYRELHGAAAQPEYPTQLEEKLLQQLMKGDREGAAARLREMFDVMRERRSANPGEQQWLSFQLLHTLARRLMELQIPETDELFDGLSFSTLCQAVLQAKSDQMKLALLQRWTDWFCGYIVERREHHSNEHVRQMLDYIHKHYREPISVDGIAEQIGLNRVYVGRLFKQAVNQNMADYINQVRIDKSVELMTGTNMKVMEIAEAVGFNNTHYFIKVFKKQMNVTPGKFIEQLAADRAGAGTGT